MLRWPLQAEQQNPAGREGPRAATVSLVVPAYQCLLLFHNEAGLSWQGKLHGIRYNPPRKTIVYNKNLKAWKEKTFNSSKQSFID